MADDDNKLATTSKSPSWVKQFVERAKNETGLAKPLPSGMTPYASATGNTFGAFGEAIATGGLLGTTRAMFGEHAANTAAGITAGIGALGSIALAGTHPNAAAHVRTVGAVAMGILTDRKAEALVGGKGDGGGGDGGSSMHGEEDDDGLDPVLKVADAHLRKRRTA
jgi:hypothetical protein